MGQMIKVMDISTWIVTKCCIKIDFESNPTRAVCLVVIIQLKEEPGTEGLLIRWAKYRQTRCWRSQHAGLLAL